jgi:PAS domain S-box-containing protein
MTICSQHGTYTDERLDKDSLNDKSEKPTKLTDSYFREVFDSLPDLITVLDTEHRVTYINKAAATATGRSQDEARGLHCYQIFHNSDRPLTNCPHKRLMEDCRLHQEEIYEKNLDAWLSINVSPLYDANGRLIGSIHSARDVTQIKKTEQALRESEERYHHLSEATLEGVLLSENTKILATNQVFATMVGYTTDELKGKRLIRFVAPHHRKRFLKSLRVDQVADLEIDSMKRDGTPFPIAAHTRQVTLKGRPVFQTSVRDLTQIKQSERERIEHERLFGVLQMAGAVCHELNQPLMALFGYMDIINTDSRMDEQTAFATQRIGEQIEQIKKITRKLMHITQYKTKEYAEGEHIIDIDLASSG